MAQDSDRTLRVEFYDTGGYDFAKNEWLPDTLLATVLVSESGCAIESQKGTAGEMLLTIPVLDVTNGARVTSDSNPLRWAELIPSAIRHGQSYVSVKEVKPPGMAQPENSLG